MLLGGLWHGAGWTFVIWGGLHGLYLVINHAWHGLRRQLGHDLARSTFAGRVLARSITFLAVVVAWVYFRAEDFDAANRILAGMIGLNGVQLPASYYGMFGPLAPTLETMGWVFQDTDGFHFGGVNMVVFLAALFGIDVPDAEHPGVDRLHRPQRRARRGGRAFAGRPVDRGAAALAADAGARLAARRGAVLVPARSLRADAERVPVFPILGACRIALELSNQQKRRETLMSAASRFLIGIVAGASG